MPENDAKSLVDERQPYHVIGSKVLTQAEWREKLRDAMDLFDAFKRQARKDHEL